MSMLEDYISKHGTKGLNKSVIKEYTQNNNTKPTDEQKKRADEIIGHATDKIRPSPIYDYTGASRKKTDTKQESTPAIEYDSGSVLRLGAGPLSNNAVTSGVVSGKLNITSQNKDGKYSVEKNKDYVAPRKQAEIIDRSPARKAELEAIKNPTQAQIDELAVIRQAYEDRAEAQRQKKENELGDNWFAWLGKSRDTSLPLSTADRKAQNAIGNTVAAATENVAGSLMSVIATLNELDAWTRARDEADSAKLKAAQNSLTNGQEVKLRQSNETWRADLTEKTSEYTAKAKKDLVHELSSILMNNATELQSEAYKAAGDEGKFLVDLLYTGTQMAGDLLANLIVPGSGLWVMSTRVFGQSAYEARENGADAATQLVTGLKSAVIEYLTERMGGGVFKKAYGAGIVDDAIESALGRLFKTDTGRTVIRFIMNAVNEGNEEVLSDILNPVADRLLGLDEGEGALFTDDDIGQMWYDWMLGTALGGIGGTVNLVSGSNAEQNASLRLTEAAQRALIESGLESETSTDSYKLAEKYQKTLDSGRLLSNSQVQKLTAANDMAIRSEIALQSATDAVRAVVPERAAQMFAERGEQASPELISGVTKLVGEGMPTDAEIQAIEQSNNAPEVARQLAQEYTQQEAASEEIQEAASVDGFAGTWDPDNIVESMFPEEVKNGILNKNEVAEFQGYYDDSGRTIDLNELEYVLRGYINNKYKRLNKEANKNGGNNDLDGSMGREPGKSSGKQDGTVRSGTEEDKGAHGSGENRADTGRESVRGNAQKSSDRKVSSRELGLDVGTDERNLTIIPRKDWSATSRRIADAFVSAANGFVIVRESPQIINMDGKILKISGAKTGDGKVIVSASHWLYSAEQLMLHECGHLYINGNLALLNKLRNAAVESMGNAKVNELTASYALIWKGLYNDDKKFEMAANGELTGDELKEFMRKYVEELMCDALAGIDRHRANGASKLSEAVRNAFLLETGIDIQALLDEDNAKGSTEVRTEDGKAAKEQPRNNSPPKYSIEYDANNTPFVVVDRDILSGVPENQWVKTVKDNLQKKFPDGITVGKNEINIDYQSRKEMTFSKYMQWLYTKDPQLRADKLRATDNADEILHATTGWINEGLKHPRKDNIIDFARGEVLLRVGKNDYTADVVVGMRKSGSMIMYDVLNLHPTSLAEKETSTAIAENPSPGTNRNTVPISEDSILVPKENVNSYSVDDNLEYELYEVYNGTFDSRRNEVHIGTTSNFMTDVIGAEGLELFMPAEKAYRAMKTEHQAIFEGKPYGGNINYHGLGVDGLLEILNASENPIAAYAAAPGERGKRENRIVLVTDVNADGGLGIVIEEVDTKARTSGRQIRANKAITVYPRNNINFEIQKAIVDNRILYLDKKRSQILHPGRKGSNYPTTISEADFTNNIRSFWENVKWKKTGSNEYTAESSSDELPEWKKKLAQFGKESYSADDTDGLRIRAERMSLNTLKQRLDRTEGLIRGHEMSENLTDKAKEELEQLRHDRDIFKEVINEKKKKQRELRKKTREEVSAEIEGKKTTDPRGITWHTRRRIINELYTEFHIPFDSKDVRTTIEAIFDKFIQNGKLSKSDIDRMWDVLMVNSSVGENKDYALIKDFTQNGRISASRAAMNAFDIDEWKAFKRRAYDNGMYILEDGGEARSIQAWTQLLANAFGKDKFDTSADARTQLETIIDFVEEGRSENLNLYQMARFIGKEDGKSEGEILEEKYDKLVEYLKDFAKNAKVEIELQKKTAYQIAKERAERLDKHQKAQARKSEREFQEKALSQLQQLKNNSKTAPADIKQEMEELIQDINIITVSTASAMNYSGKYEATWGDISKMYKWAKDNDPNFFGNDELERIVSRVDGKSLDSMTPQELQDVYIAAVALNNAYYNRKNFISDELGRTYTEVAESVAQEVRDAEKPKELHGTAWEWERDTYNPIHYFERLAGWNRESALFNTLAKGLESGERKMRRYEEEANQLLDKFLERNSKWIERADGQGRNGIWYELNIPELAEPIQFGKEPVFGDTVTVYMTPLQKVHMALESRNMDNLRHMEGGRTFVDKKLYSEGKIADAFGKGKTVKLAPETVKKIVSDLTEEEQELFDILAKYYNDFAKVRINEVSNALYGYDKAMDSFYAPVYTNSNYTKTQIGTYDATAEGVGQLKSRQKGSSNPSYNISAIDAFRRHVSQTSRFVGLAIPVQNFKTVLKWRVDGQTLSDVITHEWSSGDIDYINNLLAEIQAPPFTDMPEAEKKMNKLESGYIGATFGFNFSVALKVFGSWFTAMGSLDAKYAVKRLKKADTALINKYTAELAIRERGYSTRELAELKRSKGKIRTFIQSHKFTRDVLGGGWMVKADVAVARSLWSWAEAQVAAESGLVPGTHEQIASGTDPFYKAVAEKYEEAIGNTQSMYDVMHRSKLMKADGITRAFTMFHTDSMQCLNILRKNAGEARFYAKQLKSEPDNSMLAQKAKRAQTMLASAINGVMLCSLEVAIVTVLTSMLKNRDKFEDEEGEFDWGTASEELWKDLLQSLTGMLPVADAALNAVINGAFGDKIYDTNIPGLSFFNDLVQQAVALGDKAMNGGLGKGDFKDIALIVAKLSGIPFENIERYMIGIMSWVSPELAQAYYDMFEAPTKADLSKLNDGQLERAVYDMYKQFGLDRETTDEIARLYEAGYDKIIMGSIPDSITIDGVEYAIEGEAAEKYKHSRAEVLSLLNDVISSNGYQEADDETRNDMLKRLNSFAYETSKAAAVPEYDMAQWAESCQDLLELGEEIEAIALMPYTEKKSSSGSAEDNDPRYVKLIKAGVEYNNARDIEEKLTTLVPERGAKSVTQTQKVAAIAYMTIPEDEKIAAIKLIYGMAGAKSFEKYQTATSAGLSSADYADFLSALDRINDNSGVSQDEFRQAVRESGMPDYVAEQLWATYGWKKTYSRN